MTNKISYLDDGELCILTKNNISFFNTRKKKLIKKYILFQMMRIFQIKEIIKILCQKKYLNNQSQQKNVSVNM